MTVAVAINEAEVVNKLQFLLLTFLSLSDLHLLLQKMKRQKLSGTEYRRRRANRKKAEAEGTTTIFQFLIPATTDANEVLNADAQQLSCLTYISKLQNLQNNNYWRRNKSAHDKSAPTKARRQKSADKSAQY